MTVSFSISEDERKRFNTAYGLYIKNTLVEGALPYSQGSFFMELLTFWLENKEGIDYDKNCKAL